MTKIFVSKLRSLAIAATCAFAVPAMIIPAATSIVHAQELSASHMDAARKAIAATKATDSFDAILVNSSAGLKNQLTANSPDKADEIATLVDDEAIALAPRRADLENEAARLFANTFSEQELNEISAFFGSAAGTKYLDSTPILARELSKSARVWANGIARDLTTNVQEKMKAAGN